MSASFFDDLQMLAPRRVERIDLGGGAFLLQSPEPLQAHARCVGEWLEHWAQHTPDALAFAEPAAVAGGWRRLSYGALRQQVGAVAQALLDLPALRAAPAAPVVVVSDNALDHLVLLLAGMHVGRPVCTVSSGYCRLAQGDFTRIHGILRTLAPALVYASDAATYGPALQGAPIDAAVVFSLGAETFPGALHFAQLAATPETPAVMQAFAQVGPETHAKYLLTSGSTGHPKVVINTQRMLCANQQMLAQTLRFLQHEPTVLLDWLPWSHTFGANHNVNMVLRAGGQMYIDDGRPLPGAIDKTIAHLRHVQPSVHFNVPRGYEMMLPALEADDALARHFFGRLRMLFYAGAGMPVSTWQRLQAVAARVRAEPLWLTTSWGSTETAPAVTFAHWQLQGPGVIGRVAEDFKLTSGTWVSVGLLRVKLVSAMAPYVQDAVITGHDRSEVGVLLLLSEAGRALPQADCVAMVQAALRGLRAEQAGSAQTPRRALLLPDAPNAAAGEITDKGYVNQRLTLTRRNETVLALYAEPAGDAVIRP